MWAGPGWSFTLGSWISTPQCAWDLALLVWKPIFNTGSLICFSALSSTVPSTVPASLGRNSISHVFLYKCLSVLRCSLSHRDVMPLSPPGEISSWKKKKIWRFPLVQTAGLDFQRACDMWAATLFSFLLLPFTIHRGYPFDPTVLLMLAAWIFCFLFYSVTLIMIM